MVSWRIVGCFIDPGHFVARGIGLGSCFILNLCGGVVMFSCSGVLIRKFPKLENVIVIYQD